MNLQTMLEREEGRKCQAYGDPLTGAAPWTIGIGHTAPGDCHDTTWTDAQVDAAFAADVARATAGCAANLSPWFGELNDARQGVLIGMAFQMGIGGLLGFVHTLASVRDGRYAEAAAGIRSSKWGVQTPARARRMADQMQTGAWS